MRVAELGGAEWGGARQGFAGQGVAEGPGLGGLKLGCAALRWTGWPVRPLLRTSGNMARQATHHLAKKSTMTSWSPAASCARHQEQQGHVALQSHQA